MKPKCSLVIVIFIYDDCIIAGTYAQSRKHVFLPQWVNAAIHVGSWVAFLRFCSFRPADTVYRWMLILGLVYTRCTNFNFYIKSSNTTNN